MVTSHLGRPTEGKLGEADSLAPVAARLGELLGREVRLVRDWVDGGAWHGALAGRPRAARELPLQRGREERRRRARAANGEALRRLLQRRVRHRASRRSHDARDRALSRRSPARDRCSPASSTRSAALAEPARPLVAIVAGSKVSTKLTILRALLAKVDTLIVGGGIANTFVLAAGGRIGKSLAEPDLVGEARAILDEFPGKVPVPVDVVCAKRFAADATPTIKAIADVADDDLILDIGPRTVAMLRPLIARRRHDRVERSGRRVRVRRVRGGHARARRGDRRRRRRSRSPAAATRSRRSRSSASPTASATSRPAAAHSSNSSKARRCPAVAVLEAGRETRERARR